MNWLGLAVTLTAGLVPIAFCPLAAATETSVASQFDDMAWLLGTWQANAMGGVVTTHFRQALDGSMMCTVEIVIDHRISRYEICRMTSDEGGMFYESTAYTPTANPAFFYLPRRDLISWEISRILFDGIGFTQTSRDSMTVEVKLESNGAPDRQVAIHYTRLPDSY